MALLIPSSIPERWIEIHESAKALLEAIGLIIRQELERVRTSSSTSEEHRDIPGSKRALAVSKTEAAKDFGVSHRTIDYSIALREISVFLQEYVGIYLT